MNKVGDIISGPKEQRLRVIEVTKIKTPFETEVKGKKETRYVEYVALRCEVNK